ncbi:hypothetical protein Rhopal_006816-T1 [Rhodotorula paludigena]|uniref:Oxysterol-binding protein n=1 Tax=Rhodotorula paludigena TaxID=86838 RepID=A0AAV5GTB2_9BASI|nr:hypothetical protein Rhopal_006816-T1 [Rhodotorula paludigena]
MSDEGTALPPAQKSSWGSFLKSLASFSGDLSGLTAPSFILAPFSLTEFPSYWGEPKDFFAAIADGKTAEERHLLVTRWFLSTLSGQFTRREKETGSEKKPFNPFLGEQFLGSWDNGELVLHVEQVSHHPPITAYHLENKKKGIVYEGNCAQKTSFSARQISVKQVGHGLLRVKLPSGETETYLITLPKLKIEGLWTGRPYVELTETSYIQASHGLTSTIKYSGAGWVSGTSHSHSTTVTSGAGGPTLYTLTGTWTGETKYAKPSRDGKEGQVFFDASSDAMRTRVDVKPVEEQNEFESRRAWKAVADGIRSGDYDSASQAKSALENAERQRRKDEQARGETFQLRLFDKRPNDPEYKQLAHALKFKPEEEDSWVLKTSAA